MQNKAFYVAIAVVSLVTIWWLSSSNTDNISLSESEKNDSASPLSKNVKSSTTPKVFYSSPREAKPKPVDTLDIKEPLKKAQPKSWDESAIETTHNARLQSGERLPGETPTPEELPDPGPTNEYSTGQETELNNDYVDAANTEIQIMSQQLQAMRDAGLGEAAVREAEEKLIQLQRVQDQQSISKAEEISEDASF